MAKASTRSKSASTKSLGENKKTQVAGNTPGKSGTAKSNSTAKKNGPARPKRPSTPQSPAKRSDKSTPSKRTTAKKVAPANPAKPKTPSRTKPTTQRKQRLTPEQLVEAAKQKRPSKSAAAEIMGHISWLMMLSPQHKQLFIGDLEWLMTPPVTLKQFRLYRTDKTPWAYASWAFLTEEAEQRLIKGERRLQPAEWRAGNRPWLIDVISPFGGAEGVLKDIRETVLPDYEVKALAPGEDGKGMRVMVLRGKNVAPINQQSSELKK